MYIAWLGPLFMQKVVETAYKRFAISQKPIYSKESNRVKTLRQAATTYAKSSALPEMCPPQRQYPNSPPAVAPYPCQH